LIWLKRLKDKPQTNLPSEIIDERNERNDVRQQKPPSSGNLVTKTRHLTPTEVLG